MTIFRNDNYWIPIFMGMTERGVGATKRSVGMTIFRNDNISLIF